MDVDNRELFESTVGDEILHRLLTEYPATVTPSGGLHLWFRLPLRVDAKKLPRNLAYGEFIYEGFYALVPPSQATNKSGDLGAYTSITPLPERIDRVPAIPHEYLNLVRGAVPTTDIAIKQGHRRSALLGVGLELSRVGATADQIDVALRRLNPTLSPPLNELELTREVTGVVNWIAERDPQAAKRQDTGSKVEFLSMQELANRPTPSWLIPNWIPDRGLGFLIGPPGAGKSHFLLELAQAVCRNAPVFKNPEAMPSRTGWVLVFLPEASASWAARTKAYCDYHSLDYCDDFVCCIQQNDLANPTTWDQILCAVGEQSTQRGEPPVLVIVDTLSASVPGREENGQADMTLVTSHLQALVAMGASVIVAHHTMKHGDKYRGSSVLLGNCDWMISIVPSGRLREFRAVKLRDASDIDGRAFEIKSHGDSAVCVGTKGLGPWARLDSVVSAHPGLVNALIHHGFEMPGRERAPRGQDDLRGAGVPLKTIQATWNRFDPIRPAEAEDPRGYKSAHGKRTTALLSAADALVQGGVLSVTMGTFSRKTRDLKVVVRQAVADEED